MDDIRKAGDYTIINSMRIGNKEYVLGENMNDKNGNFYYVADYEWNEIFESYTNALISPDYLEIAKIYAQRLSKAIQDLEKERVNKFCEVITVDKCIPVGNETFTGKIVVLKDKSLLPEYRNECYQIVRCTGGNGAKADGLGTSVFCRDFFSNEDEKFRRMDVLGMLKEEHYPEWLKSKLKDEQNLQKKKKPKEVER